MQDVTLNDVNMKKILKLDRETYILFIKFKEYVDDQYRHALYNTIFSNIYPDTKQMMLSNNKCYMLIKFDLVSKKINNADFKSFIGMTWPSLSKFLKTFEKLTKYTYSYEIIVNKNIEDIYPSTNHGIFMNYF